ncbi:AAA family ATPase [Pontibacter mangrovi]|uniref:AAA family ATPase n=1 Tax=Pontibacter mangrovi TaxID=2589816 RepID=A0A501W4N3_9BACT|nr:AAA family ATPase [Pontibacter mangrovi]TPE43615.1 AAA family ATPase [Pontibacter mangrovi]
MHPENYSLSNLRRKNFELEKVEAKINATDIFAERQGIYLNEFNLFVARFNQIPIFIHEINIDCIKANKWFLDTYAAIVQDFYYTKRYYDENRKPTLDDVVYFLYEDLMVCLDSNYSTVRFLFNQTDVSKVEEIVNGIHKHKHRKERRKPTISVLVNTNRGIATKSLKVTKPKLSIEDNYNEDFKEVHETILKRLTRKNDKGIVLLHGKPGTGKTSYIRYLIASTKKNVIFLPPNMATAITNPDLISILIDNPNSIFVIEDAENIVVDREKSGGSPVSTLLNISDGLLSDCLNIQIICSFNTDISKIDSALLRKGRLIAKYEFRELATERANLLSQKLGFESNFSAPATLTTVYNQTEKDFKYLATNKLIGFKT